MKYTLKTLLEFARLAVPHFEESYRMFLAKPKDLIGKKVISICSGFSNSGGGQIMIVDSIKYYGPNNDIPHLHLMPCEESKLGDSDRKTHRGWGCKFKDKHTNIIFYKP